MPHAVFKPGISLLIAACFGSVSCLLQALPSVAQQSSQDETLVPVCIPRVASGFVKCNFENGDNYVGYIANGIIEGRGVYVYADGDRYDGEFRNGKPHGRGIFITKDDARFEGNFQNGNIIQGIVFFPDGNRYEGTFRLVAEVNSEKATSQPSGRGTFYFGGGSRYVGEFFAGQPFGRGTLIRADGSRCDGQFFNESLDAKVSSCRFSNGTTYRGELRQGVPHGHGTLTNANGQRFIGVFREGQFVRPAR